MVIKHLLLHSDTVPGTLSNTLHHKVITLPCELCLLQLCLSLEKMRLSKIKVHCLRV